MSHSAPLVCSGCRSDITDDGIICSKCDSPYDLVCANITKEAITKATPESISSWLCMICRSKVPRGDNSNTPVRPPTHSTTMSPTGSENVTNFRGGARRGRQPVKELPSDVSTADVIRTVFREELEKIVDDRLSSIMKQTLSDHLSNCELLQNLKLLNDRVATIEARLENITAEISTSLKVLEINGKSLERAGGFNCIPSSQQALPLDSHDLGLSESLPPPLSATTMVETTKQGAVSLPRLPTTSTTLQHQQSKSILQTKVASTRVSWPECNSHQTRSALTAKDSPTSAGWTTVQPKRRRVSSGSVLRGTAAPGTTKLEASERWRYLHLFYVKQGTSENQVRDHLVAICGNDVCTVEVLKARGNYASFKVGVPSKLTEKVMATQNWAEDICVKPWRQNFRTKSNETK